uniref:Phosphodiesterase n=1 Tax=Timema cristinae TaxID=61476 RepID=A0A7R9D1P0_TIMCR|nr:unnamed protein product [Timema cristinae]
MWLVSHATPSCQEVPSPCHPNFPSGPICTTSAASRGGSGATTPVRKISAHEFERGGLLKPIVNTIDGTPTFLSVVPAGSEVPQLGHSGGGPRTHRRSRHELRQLDEKELIFELVKDICNELDVRSLCHKILQNVSVLLNADRGSLFLVQGERVQSQKDPGSSPGGYRSRCLVSKLFDVCSRSTLREMEKKDEIRIPWGTGIVGYVAESGEPVNIPDAYKAIWPPKQAFIVCPSLPLKMKSRIFLPSAASTTADVLLVLFGSHCLAQTTATAVEHVEIRDSRIKVYYKNFTVIFDWVEAHSPFDPFDCLRSVSTGIIGNEKINCDYAEAVGAATISDNVGKMFGDVKLKRKSRVSPLSAFNLSIAVLDQTVPINSQMLFMRVFAMAAFRQANFLAYHQNKANLIQMLTFSFRNARISVRQARTDADTLIVDTTLANEEAERNVTVIGTDTGVLAMFIARVQEWLGQSLSATDWVWRLSGDSSADKLSLPPVPESILLGRLRSTEVRVQTRWSVMLHSDDRFNHDIDVLTGYKTRTLLCMPIKDCSGDVIGVAQVINKQNDSCFTVNDEKVFNSYLQFCGIGLRNAQLYEKSQLEVKRNQVLLDLARMIFEEQSTIEHMVLRILTHTQSLIQCQRVQVLLVHRASKGSFSRVFDFEANDLNGDDTDSRTSPFESRFPINIGITGYVATTGEWKTTSSLPNRDLNLNLPVLGSLAQHDTSTLANYATETVNIPNAYEDERFDPSVDESTGFRHKSILCMAIKNSSGQIIGVIQLINKFDDLVFTKNDENFVEAFAIFCGMGIHNTHMYEKAVIAMAKQSVTLEVLSYHASASVEDAQRLKLSFGLKDLRVPSSQYYQLYDFKFDDIHMEDDDTLKACIRMFLDLDFIERFHIDYEVLCRWLLSVKKNYRNVTYHNWRHAFNVAQMMFSIITATQWWKIFGEIECMALIIACLCHDLDHRGTNNSFQIKASSPLAQLYSTSTMEHHHFDQCIMILNSQGNQILGNVSPDEYSRIIKVLEDAILSTDLAVYFRKRGMFLNLTRSSTYNWAWDDHRELLRAMTMTVCDLAAITKPWEIEKRVAELVSSEFFEQGDIERQELHITPIDIMNREKEDQLPLMQVGFIDSICLPIYEEERVQEQLQEWNEEEQECGVKFSVAKCGVIVWRIEVALKCKDCVPIVTHTAESWTMNERETRKGGAKGMKFVRSILDVMRRNKIRNEVNRECIGVQEVHEIVEEARLRWYGHAMRMEKERMPNKMLEMKYVWKNISREEQITESVQAFSVLSDKLSPLVEGVRRNKAQWLEIAGVPNHTQCNDSDEQ